MVTIYLGLGSNLGNKRKNIKKAIKLLKEKVTVKKISSFYRTKPVGYLDQPYFINAVIEIQTDFLPYELLKLVKSIEKELGRKKTFRWGPRLIDIDILLYQGKKLKSKILTIPHPHIFQRDFVLKPLKEIAPDLDEKVFKWKK